MRIIKRIDDNLCKIFKCLAYGAGVICGFMMILSVVNVITRTIFNAPIYGAVEIISYFALVLGAFALAWNEIGDGNITMTLLTDNMRPLPKNVCQFFTSILSALFYTAISYKYFEEISVTLAKGTATTTVGIPMWIVNTIMTLGFVVATLALLLKAFRCAVFMKTYNKEGGNNG